MVTVKDLVGEIYQQASAQGLNNLIIYLNELGGRAVVEYQSKEDCPAGSLQSFYNGTVLTYNEVCGDLTLVQRSFLQNLGFDLKPSCFYWTRDPSKGYSGWEGCHIQYTGRELTIDELWLNDLRNLAIAMGYDIRSCAGYPEGDIGWGFYSSDPTSCIQKFIEFYQRTGIGGSSTRITVPGGYIQAYTMIYLANMYKVMEPYVPPECEEGAHEILEMCSDGVTEKHWRDCIEGHWVEDHAICPVTPPSCQEGEIEVIEYCPEPHSDIPKSWKVCSNGEWWELTQDCPAGPTPTGKITIVPVAMGTIIIGGLLYYLLKK